MGRFQWSTGTRLRAAAQTADVDPPPNTPTSEELRWELPGERYHRLYTGTGLQLRELLGEDRGSLTTPPSQLAHAFSLSSRQVVGFLEKRLFPEPPAWGDRAQHAELLPQIHGVLFLLGLWRPSPRAGFTGNGTNQQPASAAARLGYADEVAASRLWAVEETSLKPAETLCTGV